MNRQLTIAALLITVISCGMARVALAQCPDPIDEVLTFPGDNATDVPTNAVLRAEFPPTRDPLSPPTWIILDTSGSHVAGESDWDGSTATFAPAAPFAERAAYFARVTASGTGEFWDFNFRTGMAADSRPPSFGGLAGISFREETEDWLRTNCRLARGNAFVFNLHVPRPSDDMASDELCYYVYQTSGPGGTGLVGRLRDEDRNEIVLMHSLDEGEGEFCFRVEVRDLVGNFDGNRREQCVEAVAGAIFDDVCSTVCGLRQSSWPAVPLSLGLILLLVVRRRRRGAAS